MKKLVATFLISSFLFSSSALATPTLEGHAEFSDKVQQLQQDLFTGEIEHLERKDIIHMTVSQVLDGSIHMEGDEFFAEVTNEVYGDSGVIIPKGTLAHGKISQVGEPGKMGKSAWLELDFDYLVTPDGREIPIEGKMSTKLHPIKAATKIVATDIGYTAAGGVLGGIFAAQALGVEAAIASQGYTLASGAALGSAVGLGMALYRKGKDVLISPGDEIKVKILSGVELPVYNEEALKQKELTYPGLNIRIGNIIYEKDPFGEVNTITLSISVSNMSDKAFSGMDMALISDYNKIYNPSIFGDTKMIFSQFNPGERKAGKISFAVDNVKHSYWLIVNDRGKNKPLVKVSLDNAYKKVSEDVKKRNNKLKKHKKNYYKESDPFDI